MNPSDPRPANTTPETTVPPTHPAEAATPPALAQPLSLNTLTQALARCWPLALGVGLVAGLVGAAVMYLVMPGKYVAQAQIHISTVPTAHGVHESGTAFDHYVKTQSATLTGDNLVKRVVRQPDVGGTAEIQAQGDPELYLQKNLTTDTLLGPELLRVNLAGDRPEDLAVILNALTKQYLADYAVDEEEKVKQRIEHLVVAKQKYTHTLNGINGLGGLRAKYADALKKAELEDPQTVQSRFQAALLALDNAKADKRKLERDLIGAEAELAQEKDKAANPPKPNVTALMIDDEMGNNVVYKALQEAVASNQAAYDAAVAVAKNPASSQTQLDRLTKSQADLDAMRNANRGKVEEKVLAKTKNEIAANVARLDTKVLAIKEQLKRMNLELAGDGQHRGLQSEFENIQKQMEKAAKLPPDVQAIRDEITGLEQILARINLEVSTLEVERPRPRITLKQAATPPAAPKLDKFLKYGAVAFLGMFILGAMSVAVVECFRRRVYGATDVSQGLGINLLGTVPKLPDQARKPLPAATPEEYALMSPMTESVDTIRTLLLRSPRTNGLKVVVVTSAVGGEGKTSLACHLAASLARSGKRTVLLDSDLRKPAVHKQFDLPLGPGFSEVLRCQVELDDVLLPTPVNGLSVIPAGQWDPAATQALALDAVAACFDQLRQDYDYVLVDVPPVLPLADALMVGQHADAAVFAVLRDVSRIPAVWQAYQRLASLGIRMLGAVVIGETPGAYGTYAVTASKGVKV